MSDDNEVTERLIPIDAIDAPEWNSRTTVDPAKLKSLGETIKAQGQLQAIKVETNGDRYRLVWGSRRWRAMTEAGYTEIRARVFPPSTRTARMLENALENVQREDLTTFELARTCMALKEEGLKLKEMAQATGMSESYVSNLAITYNGLSPDILADWQAGHEAAVVSYLRDLVKTKDHAEQVAIWTAHKASFEAAMDDLYGDDEEEEETESEEKDKPKPTTFSVPISRYNELLKALKAVKAPALGLNVAQYLVGKIEKITGIIEASDDIDPEGTEKAEKSKTKTKTKKPATKTDKE